MTPTGTTVAITTRADPARQAACRSSVSFLPVGRASRMCPTGIRRTACPVLVSTPEGQIPGKPPAWQAGLAGEVLPGSRCGARKLAPRASRYGTYARGMTDPGWQREIEDKVYGGVRLSQGRRRGAVRLRRPGLARPPRPPQADRAQRRPGDVQRQPAPEPHQRVQRLLRVLLVPAQARREDRVHDAGRRGRRQGQGDGGRAAHRAAHRQWPAPDAAVEVLPAGAARAEGGAARGLAQVLHRHRDPLVREDLRAAGRRDPRRADRRRPGLADRRRRGDLRLGDPGADRRPRHALGGLVAHPPAGPQQGPAHPGDDAVRPHRGAAAPGRPRASGCASCRTRPAGSRSSSRCATSTTSWTRPTA